MATLFERPAKRRPQQLLPRLRDHSLVQVTGKRVTALMPLSRCACRRLAGPRQTVADIFSDSGPCDGGE